MLSQSISNFLHFYLLGGYYVLVDNIFSYRCRNIKLGEHAGEVAVVTGGHRGIGAMITKDLLSTGMHVIIGCRKEEEGNKFVSSLRNQGVTTGKVTVLLLDLASLESVKSFSEAVLRETSTINLIINNAGITPTEYTETEDKIQTTWQVNYLSHFLLSHLLLPTLQSTPGVTRIVSTTSLEHKAALTMDLKSINDEAKFNWQTEYARSKLAQIMFTLYLNDKLRSINSNVEVLAAHPGIVDTEIFDGTPLKYLPFIPKLFFKSPAKGAKPIVYAALLGKGGQYIGNCAPESTSKLSKDKAKQLELFEESKKSLQITKYGNLF